jgi:phenylalanyl-tRNA synthetase alpha chain
MLEKIEEIRKELENNQPTATKEALEQFRMRFISRKSVFSDFFEGMKSLGSEEKKLAGQHINVLKNMAQDIFRRLNEELEAQEAAQASATHPDLTLPVVPHQLGTVHPVTQVKEQMITIFERLGFHVSDGPEMETEWYNFSALNFPENHPAREMQDTFFLTQDKQWLLRTHTSNVQIRQMEKQKPPIRSIMPGRVYRNEAISSRAHCLFHQMEGLYIDKNVSFADLKNTMLHFAKEMYGPGTKIRLRPSFFPFTEPSAELDISCFLCGGKGCKMCKHTGWLEIGGCGMVDPNVLQNCGIDPEIYTGFAFGMGIERIALLKYRIDDIRLFTENDVRFLRQFSAWTS